MKKTDLIEKTLKEGQYIEHNAKIEEGIRILYWDTACETWNMVHKIREGLREIEGVIGRKEVIEEIKERVTFAIAKREKNDCVAGKVLFDRERERGRAEKIVVLLMVDDEATILHEIFHVILADRLLDKVLEENLSSKGELCIEEVLCANFPVFMNSKEAKPDKVEWTEGSFLTIVTNNYEMLQLAASPLINRLITREDIPYYQKIFQIMDNEIKEEGWIFKKMKEVFPTEQLNRILEELGKCWLFEKNADVRSVLKFFFSAQKVVDLCNDKEEDKQLVFFG